MEEIEILNLEESPKTNEPSTVLLEDNFKEVIYQEYWDSHGNLIPWEEPKKFKNCHVKIIKNTYTQFGQNWESWDAEIDGKKIDGDVYNYKGNVNRLVIKATIGWG